MDKFTAFMKKVWQKIKNFFTKAYYFIRNVARAISRHINSDAGYGLKKTGRVLGRILGGAARLLLAAFLVLMTTGVILVAFGAIYVTHYLEVDTRIVLSRSEQAETGHMLARDPENPDEWIEIHSLSQAENRIWVDYENIPQKIIDCVVAMEDKRFWEHEGVDWKRTIAAFANMFLGLREEGFGGSTITQQLIKNNTGNDEVTVARKLQEIFTAMELEESTSKETIMEWYLNTIYLGKGCNGIKTAAMRYFGKELEDLTLAECASLVGITNNPSAYDPYNSPKNNKTRQERILLELYNQQYITETEYKAAVAQKLVLAGSKQSVISTGKVRSWYVDEVISNLISDYMSIMNCTEQVALHAMTTGGWNVYTCVDLDMQKKLDDIWQNPESWPDTPDEEPPESSMVIMDNATGQIKALTGGREKTGDMVESLATRSKRQPGSSIKPITVYAPAFELGVVTPYSVLDDSPVAKVDNRAWPRNSPQKYEGLTTVLQGVTQSKNTISLKTLELVDKTYRRSFDFAVQRFNLTSLVESKQIGTQILSDMQPSPLAFGALTTGVTVRELCSAYASFPNRGVYNPGITYTEVRDVNGELIFENPNEPHVAVKEKTAYYMTTCLINAVNGAGGTGSRARIPDMPVAGKTGTTSANKDRWFAGYTPYYTAVCWFGYVIGRDMSYYTINPAVHMWQQVMAAVHEGLPRLEFETPENLVSAKYCLDSGMSPTQWCELDPRGSRVATGKYDKDDVPRQLCSKHIPVEIDIASGHPVTPYCPAETRQTIGMLTELFRIMPVDGINLPDEQYVFHEYGVYPYYFVPEGWFPAVGIGDEGKTPFRDSCEFHKTPEDTYPPDDPDDPDNPDNPDDHGDPDNPDDPGDTGDPFDGLLPWGGVTSPPEAFVRWRKVG